MVSSFVAVFTALLPLLVTRISCEYTNLPDAPPGVFNASARIEIKSTVEAAWEALNDFPNYAAWNPFVRYAIALSPENVTLPEQRPIENSRLFFRVQIPPLELPVNRDTPDDPLHTQVTYENVTHVQPELRRLAWKYHPDTLLDAERWQALSDFGTGTILYESREVYAGALAETLKSLMGEGLQKSFEGQAKGLKLFLESNPRSTEI